jgi:hypothetical protein
MRSRDSLIQEKVMCRKAWSTALCALVICVGFSSPALAQFDSGSTGVHGPLPPAAIPTGTNYMVFNMTTGLIRYCSNYDTNLRPETCTTQTGTAQLPGIPAGGLTTGVFHFTNVDLQPPNTNFLEVYFVGNPLNNPLTFLAQNEIRIGGVNGTTRLKLDGLAGRSATSSNLSFGLAGGDPGPGGSTGGQGGIGGSTPSSGNPGFGTAGGGGGSANASTLVALRGSPAGSSVSSFSLTPHRGGSGGGGGAGFMPNVTIGGTACGTSLLGYGGGGGGGGGGGVLLAATNAIVFGNTSTQFDVSGGSGGDNAFTNCRPVGGGGEGGNLRLVSRSVTGAANLVLTGGSNAFATTASGGKLRIEANTNGYTGTISGASGGSFTQFPSAAIPSDLPVLRITAIGGVAVPPQPTGNLATPDVNFATPPTNPVSVALAASRIPLGTTISVRVTPVIGTAATSTSGALVGTLADSTATASVTIPPGPGAISATATFTLPPQSAQLLGIPNLDGTKPQQVEVVAGADGVSRVYLVADNGARFELGSR